MKRMLFIFMVLICTCFCATGCSNGVSNIERIGEGKIQSDNNGYFLEVNDIKYACRSLITINEEVPELREGLHVTCFRLENSPFYSFIAGSYSKSEFEQKVLGQDRCEINIWEISFIIFVGICLFVLMCIDP